ncbi:MAG: DUF5011 domain-containing protein, partial [Bacteroidetes bacterium]|nr:DUF5011 domain-containing protein [Bacteroidota bacterium]
VLTLYGALVDTIEVFGTWTEPGYKAEDLVDGDITGSVTVSNPLKATVVGTYVIGYGVADSANNTATASRTVVVVDVTSPQISLVGSDTVRVQIFTPYAELGTTHSDNYDPTLGVDMQGNVDTANLGWYSVGYCVTDASGNGPVCVTRWVEVIDTIVPVIALNGNDNETVEVFGFYQDAGYTVSENHDYSVAVSGTWSGTPDVLGNYTITYTVTDMAGNSASVTREIDVVDSRSPVMVLNGNWVDSVGRWADYVDASVTVTDNYYESDQITIDVSGTFNNTQTEGVYTIEYRATDPSGNASGTITRMVVVIENLDGLGMSDAKYSNWNLFPNPGTGLVYVAVPTGTDGNLSLRVLDLSGKEILLLGNQIAGNGLITLDLSALESGTYMLEIVGERVREIRPVAIVR